jgi:hypothetical protein
MARQLWIVHTKSCFELTFNWYLSVNVMKYSVINYGLNFILSDDFIRCGLSIRKSAALIAMAF